MEVLYTVTKLTSSWKSEIRIQNAISRKGRNQKKCHIWMANQRHHEHFKAKIDFNTPHLVKGMLHKVRVQKRQGRNSWGGQNVVPQASKVSTAVFHPSPLPAFSNIRFCKGARTNTHLKGPRIGAERPWNYAVSELMTIISNHIGTTSQRALMQWWLYRTD